LLKRKSYPYKTVKGKTQKCSLGLYFNLYISPGQFSVLEYFSVADSGSELFHPGSRMQSLKDPNSGPASKIYVILILTQKIEL
jgi:hypothetical protein